MLELLDFWLKENYSVFFKVLGLMAIAWFLNRLVHLGEKKLREHANDDPHEITTIMAISRILRSSIMIIFVLMSMQSLGYSIEGVLAFGGIGGMAVGFAAKDMLANFFGGLMIYWDRPFVVGDVVRSPDRNIEGTVEYIGWRATKIQTPERRPLYIPNSIFSNIAVENPTRMSHRRIKEVIGIRYDDVSKLKAIIADIKSLLDSQPELDKTMPLAANLTSFGDSSLNITLEAYSTVTHPGEYLIIKENILFNIIDIVARHKAEMAFPTSTVHLVNDISISTQGSI